MKTSDLEPFIYFQLPIIYELYIDAWTSRLKSAVAGFLYDDLSTATDDGTVHGLDFRGGFDDDAGTWDRFQYCYLPSG